MSDVVERVWDILLRDPATAFARAQDVLAEGATSGERAQAWAELTIAYHQLLCASRSGDEGARLERARTCFERIGDRRGELLARTGIARLAIVLQSPLSAREALLAIHDEALPTLPPQDRFWVANALGATYYYTDRTDETIRYLYEALETLRSIDVSPQLPAVMSNLAAALVAVGDYEPARELARDALGLLEHFDNANLRVLARGNLAEALLGLGERDAALDAVDAMLADTATTPLRATQNHDCATAAETYALHGRHADAERCVETARAILDEYPGGYNEAHFRWAAAALADARDDDKTALAALDAAIIAGEQLNHLPTLCKSYERAAERCASLGRFEEAFLHGRRLVDAQARQLSNRASARYYLVQVQHELAHAAAERERAERQRHESDAINRQLERLDAELALRMREIEALRQHAAFEDPTDRGLASTVA